MAKIYKSKKTRKKGHQLPAGWGYLVIGLVIGLGIGLIAYLTQARLDKHAPAQAVTGPLTGEKPQGNPDAPQKLPAPQFDFYTLLPEMEVVIPEIDELPVSSQRNTRAEKKEAYVLQTGSFRRFDEADSLKANLALIGIEANIQTVAINGEDSWYRVRIGPYRDFDQLRQVRTRLKQNDIDFIVLKINQGADE